MALFVASFVVTPSASASSVHQQKANIEHKKNQTHAKIKRLKILENIETNKLYKNQQKLENTSQNLNVSQNNYKNAETELGNMQNQLAKAYAEFAMQDFQMKRRIRQVYKKQRLGFFQLLFDAKDYNNLLDTMYFEGIVIKHDYRKMNETRQKAKNIAVLKYNIEQKKRVIARSIRDINYEQQNLQSEISKNQNMIVKLRTDRATYEKAERELARQSASLESMISRSSRNNKNETQIKVVSGFIKPIPGPITSSFGYRVHPIFHSRTFHSGIDIGGPFNGNVRASNSGKVIYAGWYGGYGKVVIIDHGIVRGQPITTLYAHLNVIKASAGQYVSKGQTIGLEGSTGYSTGPHCHFEVRVNGRPTQPLNYI